MRLREADWYHLIPLEVKEVLRVLHESGHTAWLVGGAVRDFLLGSTPKDFDLATSARPEEVAALFPKTIQVGAQFGITVVVVNEAPVEVATFRKDGLYVDGRHPEGVEYSSPQEDAERRDFTINGLFWCPVKRQVIDYVGGLDDLDGRLIRAIGVAADRYEEDSLRMLRLFRFLAQLAPYGFQLDGDTLAAVRIKRAGILRVSPERVTQELRRLFASPDPLAGLMPLVECGLWREWWKQEPSALSVPVWAGERPTPFTAWLSHLGVSDGDKSRVTLSREEGAALRSVPELCASLLGAAAGPFHILKPLLAREDFFLAHSRLSTLNPGEAARLASAREKFLAAGTLDPAPLLTGADLVAQGFKPGKELGAILKKVRDAQLDENVKTREEALEIVGSLGRMEKF